MQEAIAAAHKQANSYKLLSECYYLPDSKLIHTITDAAQTDPFFAELARHISAELDLESLRIDYSRLFVGPFKLLAPPYGSFYLEDKKLMGDSTIDVKKCYDDEGLDIVIKDAPDHITMELEFMYYLVAKQIEAAKHENLQMLQIYQQKQHYFLQIHLGRWLPAFAENIKKNARTEFYGDLARLTETFVLKDMEVCARGLDKEVMQYSTDK
ncbi:MAG: TorD/DmsD family molecular chaperone [Planctomycetota bacterium]|jgi:TorA maturation chaperone TorD